MVTTIATARWERLDTPGIDTARVSGIVDGYELIGDARTAVCDVRYRVNTDVNWNTTQATVTSISAVGTVVTTIGREPAGWTLNGSLVMNLSDLVDLDLDFTPSTNFLHLQRLALSVGEQRRLDAAWYEMSSSTLTRLPQVYKRTGMDRYEYEAERVGYRGTLEIGANGFVLNYPGLWRALPLA